MLCKKPPKTRKSTNQMIYAYNKKQWYAILLFQIYYCSSEAKVSNTWMIW